VSYPYKTVLEALAYVFAERHRMLRALLEMGHAQAYELEPRESRLGTPRDPFILMTASDRQIARYYIEADEERCWVRYSGSVEFIAKLTELALRDGGHSVH
jgi:hypothetical protein